MSDAFPRLLIAGTASGVGKTTFTAGLCRALRRRGLHVATFKCGPDYLDPSYHRIAGGRACHNLDGYMMGRDAVARAFVRNAGSADISLIEGMMGLFDGATFTGLEGSSAELALWLEAPSILVCDASAMARSLAALVHGFASFEPRLRLAGVIANRIGGAGHRALLASACTGVPLLGGLPADAQHRFVERQLGLRTAHEVETEPHLEAWADAVEANCDVDRLLELARSAPPLSTRASVPALVPERCRIAVAHDDAFHFYYDENLRMLAACGAKLSFFSPLKDHALPEVDGVYIGGGYPELHAARLAANGSMRASLRAFAASERPIYAECGGLMYLSNAIVDANAARHDMVGLIDGVAVMHERMQAIGYVEVETRDQSLLGPAGTRARGHQFRYSRLEQARPGQLYALRTPGSGGQIVGTEGYVTRKVCASYVHLHFASNPGVAQSFVDACSRDRGRGA